MTDSHPFLSLRLSVDYATKPGVLRNVALDVREGEVMGLIGHSGSGKSTIALSILRLLALKGGKASGSICLRGRDVMQATEREMRSIRGREIGLVLQSPLSSLNPALRIGTQLSEAWRAHATGTAEDCLRCLHEALRSVSLPHDHEFLKRYPAQLSVGQAQRVLIAMAILHRPALLIADEPTSALDPITQSEILTLFSSLNRERDMAILYISHDLLSVASICHRVAILHDGEIVECAPPEDVFNRPSHPYTQRLVASLPVAALEHGSARRLVVSTSER
ncbi:MAG: ABC transporter ATP-binding protein [Acidobacteriia bacterium]|nr:ABC transporter ATP-binding protein [Terriglobia bacterium]